MQVQIHAIYAHALKKVALTRESLYGRIPSEAKHILLVLRKSACAVVLRGIIAVASITRKERPTTFLTL